MNSSADVWTAIRQAATAVPAPVPTTQPQATTSADSGLVQNGHGLQWGGISWNEWVQAGATGLAAVTERSARQVAAVVGCTNLIAGSISSCPCHTYTRGEKGARARAEGGMAEDLWWMLNERPYGSWSAASFWQFISDSRGFHGDGFARIHRASRFSNKIIGFEPWHPLLTDVEKIDGRLVYTFWPEDGVTERPTVLEADDVLHFPGPGFDGCRSLSQLRFGLRYPAAIALAADQQAGQFMADGARPDFAIEVPGAMEEPERATLRNSFQARHTGPGAKKTPVVLAGGMKLHQLTMNMDDAEALSTRGFQIEEICRVFGVPPWMIGHTEKGTAWGTGYEQQAIAFVTYTLQRHLNVLEQELNFKLFRTARNFAEFLTAGLTRGDIKSRFEAYRIGVGRAGERSWMLPSEIRSLENLPPNPELDKQPPPAPTPAPKPDDPKE